MDVRLDIFTDTIYNTYSARRDDSMVNTPIILPNPPIVFQF